MKAFKYCFAASLFLLISISVNAQNKKAILEGNAYNTGIGIRLGGFTSGITIKSFVNENTALEGILSFARRSFIITGLYEKHASVNNAPGLTWLYGGGAHIGFFRAGGSYYIFKKNSKNIYVLREGESAAIGGVDFIIGLEYKFKNAPLTVGADLKPFIDFYDGARGYFDGALSFRFVF